MLPFPFQNVGRDPRNPTVHFVSPGDGGHLRIISSAPCARSASGCMPWPSISRTWSLACRPCPAQKANPSRVPRSRAMDPRTRASLRMISRSSLESLEWFAAFSPGSSKRYLRSRGRTRLFRRTAPGYAVPQWTYNADAACAQCFELCLLSCD